MRATKALRKLDRPTAQRITRELKAVEQLDNPRDRGKGLTGPLTGLWRYRVGDYRIVCDIVDSQLTIIAIEIGHRSAAYD